MSYIIHITERAKSDMVKTADYIEFMLKNPDAADTLLDKAESAINTLCDFPCRYPLVSDSVLSAIGIRFITIDNYLIFYLVSKTDNAVYIIRFLYEKSNWKSILGEGFSLD